MARSTEICLVESCQRVVHGLGRCMAHYAAYRRQNPYPGPASVAERLWARVDASGPCWEWTGSKNRGYGRIGDGTGGLLYTHRAAWELLVGPIPEGLDLDHLCRNKACCNPDHLEPVTHEENMRRAPWSAAHIQRGRTHCPQGHPYSGDNVRVGADNRRRCATCWRERQRERYWRGKIKAS